VDADTVFTNGTIVPDLIPNTDYECFVIATYDGEAQCTSGDKTDVVPTLPNPPTNVSVSNPTIESLDVAATAPLDPVGGGAVPLAGYAFQCSTGLECDSNGTWFPLDDFVDDPTTPVTVSGLMFGTEYNCWAATVSGSSGSYEYSCSDLAQGTTNANVSISGLGNGVPQNESFPFWDLDAWYSGDTLLDKNPLKGLYYTMPVYYGVSPGWTTANDELISSQFISFTDTSSLGASDGGYVYLTNGPLTDTKDKADFINWFGNDTSSVVPLSTLYEDVNVTFRAAVTPSATVLRYSIKTICEVDGSTATPSFVYRFQHTDESFKEYPYDETSPFAIFWSGDIPDGPQNGYTAKNGTIGNEVDDQFTYADWTTDPSTNAVLKECLLGGTAFGSGFGIGTQRDEQTLKVDWLQQSFTYQGAKINFVQPPL